MLDQRVCARNTNTHYSPDAYHTVLCELIENGMDCDGMEWIENGMD